MRILFFVTCIICLRSCTEHHIPCLPDNLGNHVIAFYPFNDGSLMDASNNSFILVNPFNIAQPKEDRLGNVNCAYSFTGDDDSYLSRNGRFLNNFHLESFSVNYYK